MEQACTLNDPSSSAGMVIRLAGPQDTTELERLAQLDSAARLSGQVLVAEQGTVALAAMSLATGDAVADPFRPTADIVSVLHLRREQLVSAGRSRPKWYVRFGRRDAEAGLVGSHA